MFSISWLMETMFHTSVMAYMQTHTCTNTMHICRQAITHKGMQVHASRIMNHESMEQHTYADKQSHIKECKHMQAELLTCVYTHMQTSIHTSTDVCCMPIAICYSIVCKVQQSASAMLHLLQTGRLGGSRNMNRNGAILHLQSRAN